MAATAGPSESRAAESDGRAPPKLVILAVAGILGLGAWLMLRLYTSPGARECQSLYEAARTAADTARIDTMMTAGSRQEQDPHTCGFRRSSARWQ